MGKMVISSRKYSEIFNKIKGFEVSGSIEDEYGKITAYKKLKVNTENIFCLEDEYIVGVGTFFYKGEIGEAALRYIYEDICVRDINEVRKKICGTYCIACKKEGKLLVFTDNAGYYQIYYHIDANKDIVLSNTYYHVASVLEDIEVDIDTWMEMTLGNEVIRNESVFYGIDRLKPYEVLEYNYTNKGWSKKVILDDADSVCEDFWDEIKNTYETIGKKIKSHAVWCTAGQDSRASLALLFSAGLKPELFYGEGDSRITNTKVKEREIVEQIAKKFDLKFAKMNWTESNQEGIEDYIQKYGEHVRLYGFNKNIFNELENNINVECLHSGILGANVFRIPETSLRNYKEKFTIDECIDDLGVAEIFKKSCVDWKNYRRIIKERVLDAFERLNIDTNNISKIDYCKFTSYGRNDRLNNLFNMFFYCFPMLPEKKYEEYVLNIPYDNKIYSNFLLEGIYKLQKELFEIPIMSHHVLKVIDKDMLEIRNEQQGVEKVRVLLGKFWSILKDTKIREMYFLLKKDYKGHKELLEERETMKKIEECLMMSMTKEKYDIKYLVKKSDPIFLRHLIIDEIVLKEAMKK